MTIVLMLAVCIYSNKEITVIRRGRVMRRSAVAGLSTSQIKDFLVRTPSGTVGLDGNLVIL